MYLQGWGEEMTLRQFLERKIKKVVSKLDQAQIERYKAWLLDPDYDLYINYDEEGEQEGIDPLLKRLQIYNRFLRDLKKLQKKANELDAIEETLYVIQRSLNP